MGGANWEEVRTELHRTGTSISEIPNARMSMLYDSGRSTKPPHRMAVAAR